MLALETLGMGETTFTSRGGALADGEERRGAALHVDDALQPRHVRRRVGHVEPPCVDASRGRCTGIAISQRSVKESRARASKCLREVSSEMCPANAWRLCVSEVAMCAPSVCSSPAQSGIASVHPAYS